MTRIKNKSREKHKKILKENKGFKLSNSKTFKVANQEHLKALHYEFINRKKKKTNFRKLWTKRISSTIYKYPYNGIIHFLKTKKIIINRKILSKLIQTDVVGWKNIFSIKI